MKKNFLYFGLIPALLFQVIGAFLYFVLLTGTGWSGVAYGTTKILILIWPILWYWLGYRPFKSSNPLNRKSSYLWGITTGLVIVAIMLGLFFLLESQFQDAKPLLEEKLNDYHITTPQVYIIVFLLYSIIHAFIEEYYWRWFTFRGLMNYSHPLIAGIISSIGFGLHHYVVIGQYIPVTMTLILGTGVIVGGLLWCWIYHRTNSFLGAWISHIFVDLGVFGIGYLILYT